jgi:hypothetical protein
MSKALGLHVLHFILDMLLQVLAGLLLLLLPLGDGHTCAWRRAAEKA